MPSPSLAGAANFTSGSEPSLMGGRRRRQSGASVKTLKRMLKKAGLKVSGKKAALTRRVKKAHLKMRGGAEGTCSDSTKMTEEDCVAPATWTPATVEGGRRRRSGRSRKH